MNFTPTPDPLAQRPRGKSTATQIADPSATFLETDATLGVLLSSQTIPTAEGFVLEGCTWIRCIPETGMLGRLFSRRTLQQRPFQAVTLRRIDSSVYVAEDHESHRYFPYPSHEPYETRFLAVETYDTLIQLTQSQNIEGLYHVLDVTPRNLPLLPRWANSRSTSSLASQFADHLLTA